MKKEEMRTKKRLTFITPKRMTYVSTAEWWSKHVFLFLNNEL